jgi:hypothetical protein
MTPAVSGAPTMFPAPAVGQRQDNKITVIVSVNFIMLSIHAGTLKISFSHPVVKLNVSDSDDKKKSDIKEHESD